MSSDSQTTVKDENEPQYRFDIESNVLWVETFCWTFKADLQRMEVNHRLISQYKKLCCITDTFYLQIEKILPSKFAVELIRKKLNCGGRQDSGYSFQVSFTLVASPCARKVAYMNYNADSATVCFTLEDFESLYGPNDIWTIKCVLWMHEYTNLDNSRSKVQEWMWQMKLREVAPELRQCEKMAYIMGRQTLNNLFTGRQDFNFADLKSTLLLRSFRFSDKLHTDIARLKKQQEPQGFVDELGRLLGYIANGQNHCITKEDCIRLYVNAYFCGLSYLKFQCTNYLKMILTDVEIFIDVLMVSDMLNDENLSDFALDWYMKNKEKVLTSALLEIFKNRNYGLYRVFLFLFRKWEADERDRQVEYVRCFSCIQYGF